MKAIKLPPELSDGTHYTVGAPEDISLESLLDQYELGKYEIELVEISEEYYENLPEI